MIVDLGLPDLDGIEMCRRLRRWTSAPILMLTGAEDEARNIEALDAGADDYVSRPFSMPELLARVRVAVRHRRALGQVTESSLLEVGALRMDTAAHEANVNGVPLSLTRKEFALLAMLARNEGRVIRHRVLLAGVWGSEKARCRVVADPREPTPAQAARCGVGERADRQRARRRLPHCPR